MEAPPLEFPTYAFVPDDPTPLRVETQAAWDALLKLHPAMRNYPFTDEERRAHVIQPASPVPEASDEPSRGRSHR